MPQEPDRSLHSRMKDPHVAMYESKFGIDDSQVDFLDLIAVIARSWRSILITPIIAGALTTIILLSLPQKYKSVMVLRSAWWADTIDTPVALGPAALKLNQDASLGDSIDEAVSTLHQNVHVSRISEGIVSVEASFESPKKSQDVLLAILEEIRIRSKPKGVEKSNLEAELADLNSAATSLTIYQRDMARSATTGTPLEQEAKARSLSVLINDAKAIQDRVRDIKRQLEGVTEVDIYLEPTLPQEGASRHIGLLSMLSATAAGLAMIAIALIRDIISRSGRKPDGAQKIQFIKDCFRLRRPSA